MLAEPSVLLAGLRVLARKESTKEPGPETGVGVAAEPNPSTGARLGGATLERTRCKPPKGESLPLVSRFRAAVVLNGLKVVLGEMVVLLVVGGMVVLLVVGEMVVLLVELLLPAAVVAAVVALVINFFNLRAIVVLCHW